MSSRVRVKYADRKFWYMFRVEHTFRDLARDLIKFLQLGEAEISMTLDGYELLQHLPCDILTKEDIIELSVIAQPEAGPSQPRASFKRRRLGPTTEQLLTAPLGTVKAYDLELPRIAPAPPREPSPIVEADPAAAFHPTQYPDDDGSFKMGGIDSEDDKFTEVDTDDNEGAGIDYDSMTVEQLAAMLQSEPPGLPEVAVTEIVQIENQLIPAPATATRPDLPPLVAVDMIAPSSPRYEPGSPSPAVPSPAANPLALPVDSDEDADFEPAAMDFDSSSSSDEDEATLFARNSQKAMRKKMAQLEKAKPVSDQLAKVDDTLEMPMLYHPDLVKPEYLWVSEAIGFRPDHFPRLKTAPPQPDNVGLQDVPCAKLVIDWINQGREDEVADYLANIAAHKEKQKQDAIRAQIKPIVVPPVASLKPNGKVNGHVSSSDSSSESSSDSSSDDSSSSSSSSSDDSSSSGEKPVIVAHVKKPSAVPANKQVAPGSGKTTTQLRNARRRRKREALQSTASANGHGPPRPIVTKDVSDEIQKARLEAMRALERREEHDIKVVAMQNKGKSKKKPKSHQDVEASFGFATHPSVPSSRETLPSNVVVSFVDVEAPDFEPGVSLPASARKEANVTTSSLGQWAGWSDLDQVSRKFPLYARITDPHDIVEGDPLAFQLMELDYSTYAPEFATYFGKVLGTPVFTSSVDSMLLPTTPDQALPIKESCLLTIELHPTSIREQWQDSEGATSEAEIKRIQFDKMEDCRRVLLKRTREPAQ